MRARSCDGRPPVDTDHPRVLPCWQQRNAGAARKRPPARHLEVTQMQNQPTDRTAYISTRHRGLSYRLTAAGQRVYYGYIGSKRTRLQGAIEREALAEWNELRGKAARGERVHTTSVKFEAVAEA